MATRQSVPLGPMSMLRKTAKHLVLRALNAYDKRSGAASTPPLAHWGLDLDAAGRLVWDGCCIE
jgi:hypothetical protein